MDEPVRPGLIGRVVEQATLSRLLERASTGHGGSLLLAGEPGIGKSELAEWTAATASARGFTVSWGRCRETAGTPPFWPWTQIFRALQAPVLDAAAGDRGTRFALFDEATAALRAAADHAPLLVVLDDLHRADEASLRLLDFVVDQLWPAAVAIVGTYRDAEVGGLAGDVLSGLVGTRHCDLLDVSGLTVDDVAGWLAAAARAHAPGRPTRCTAGPAATRSSLAKCSGCGTWAPRRSRPASAKSSAGGCGCCRIGPVGSWRRRPSWAAISRRPRSRPCCRRARPASRLLSNRRSTRIW